MIKVLLDENLSEYFAEGLNQLQYPLGDGIEVTSIAREFYKGIKDEDWIPKWGDLSGIFITQDIRIVTTKQQALLLEKHKIGAFFLKCPKGYGYWHKVELVVKHWPEIVRIIKKNKTPYSFFITPRKIERG
ncbi:MAG: hypothetical protein EOO92_10155 [Pedobacter sp.]|nr:MAG: hypothetical protein EOO92_10155 [Pedobacter sp.]